MPVLVDSALVQQIMPIKNTSTKHSYNCAVSFWRHVNPPPVLWPQISLNLAVHATILACNASGVSPSGAAHPGAQEPARAALTCRYPRNSVHRLHRQRRASTHSGHEIGDGWPQLHRPLLGFQPEALKAESIAEGLVCGKNVNLGLSTTP